MSEKFVNLPGKPGNKCNLGNPTGRSGCPRTVSPPPEEMIELGKEMVEWVKKNKPLHLSEWWSIEKFIVSKVWDTMSLTPEFLPYYEQAMRIIGQQYLDKNSNVRDGISHRWLRVYFKDLKEEENEKAKFDAELKKQVLEEEQKLLVKVVKYAEAEAKEQKD